MKVYAIMTDMGYDGYFLDDIKSSFELAKKQVEDNGPSLHGNIDVVEWEVDNPGGVPVFTLHKQGWRGKKTWTHTKFRT